MKKLLFIAITLGVLLSVFILEYLMFAFMKADINFINWSEASRLFFVIIYGCSIMPTVIVVDILIKEY